VIIRVPLIPGINDSEAELWKIAHLAAGFPNGPVSVNLLPYHKYGMGKYQMLDRKYQLEDLNTQADPEVQKMKQLIESYGLECEIIG
jgi:pyruvate formate lyase activating enzyme